MGRPPSTPRHPESALPAPFTVYCGARGCGRPLVPGLHDDERNDWLLGPRERGFEAGGLWIVRCPRHWTKQWASACGVRWSASENAERIKRDEERWPFGPPNWHTPVPVRYVEDTVRPLVDG